MTGINYGIITTKNIYTPKSKHNKKSSDQHNCSLHKAGLRNTPMFFFFFSI